MAKAFAAMISQTAEYALRAVVYLADRKVACTTAEIAEATQIPAGYLAKVMQNLGRLGLVKSQRGLNGGFTLARDPREMSILTVINAVDPVRRFTECPLGIPDHGAHLCPLHRRLDQAATMVEAAFGKTRVIELLAVPCGVEPLCDFPATSDGTARAGQKRLPKGGKAIGQRSSVSREPKPRKRTSR